MIDKVTGNRAGYDSNHYTIEALVSIRDHIDSLPKNNQEFTEDDYKVLRFSDSYKHKGYAGYAYSYGGKWLGGWGRDSKGKRDYVNESYKNAVKQMPRLQGVHLGVSDYKDISIPPMSLVYCDPPYAGTTGYSSNFNHDQFWDWCRELAGNGHKVFVSEYDAPQDFDCLYRKPISSSLTKDTGSKQGVECLFTFTRR